MKKATAMSTNNKFNVLQGGQIVTVDIYKLNKDFRMAEISGKIWYSIRIGILSVIVFIMMEN